MGHFLRFSNALSRHIKSSSTGAALDYFTKTYDLSADQAARWLHNSPWEFSFDVDVAALVGPFARLRRLQLVSNTQEVQVRHRLAPGVRMLVAPRTGHVQKD